LVIRDKTGQVLAYIYYDDEPGRRAADNLLTKDEARAIAANIAKLLETARQAAAWADDVKRWSSGESVKRRVCKAPPLQK
jgi:hypothetical protein